MKIRLKIILLGLFFMPIYGQAVLSLDQPNPKIAQNRDCPPPMLSRLQRHQIAKGETLETLATKYKLLPETLIQLNPLLKTKPLPVGKEILVPPINGMYLEVPPGATWKDIENAYGVRADILFEINGCQVKPTVVFIPGSNWQPKKRQNNDYIGFPGYPLPKVAQIALSYGWHQKTDQDNYFHSGIDLLADVGTPVLAVEQGTVTFAGQEGNYGNLIVINHPGGRQTRYGHLGKIQVQMGQEVNLGDIIATVGTTGKPDIPQPHLHFEVRYNTPAGWVAQDPALHLKP